MTSEKLVLSALMELLTLPVFVKDLEGRYLMANRAYSQAMGRSVDEIVGRHESDLLSEDDARWMREDDAQALKSQDPWIQLHRESEGQKRVWLSTKAALKDLHGAPVGLLVIKREVTQEQRLKETVKSVIEDLQCPVFTIRISSELMLQKGGLSPEIRAMVERIHQSQESLSGILSVLMTT